MTELEQYKAFIDALVGLRSCVSAHRVRENKAWPDLPENRATNDFLAGLNRQQREVLAALLQEARDGGVHDILAYLNEQMTLKGLRLVRQGQELPIEPFETELHYDWVCRVHGDPWPDAES